MGGRRRETRGGRKSQQRNTRTARRRTQMGDAAETAPMPLHEALHSVPADTWAPRADAERTLTAWASSGQTPRLRLTAPDGSGKSALLVHWLQRHRQRHPEDFTFYFAADATLDARRPETLLHALLSALAARYGFREPVPHDPEALTELLPHWLARAAALGRSIIVLDGLERLEDAELTGEFQWLPGYLPQGVRLALSYSEQHLGTPPWQAEDQRLQLAGLGTESRLPLLRRTVPDLPDETTDALCRSDAAANPLWLQLAAQLAARTGRGPSADNPRDAALELLDALEPDADEDGSVRARWIAHLRALWAARAGLDMETLRHVTGEAPEPERLTPLLIECPDPRDEGTTRWHWRHATVREAAGQRHVREGVHRQEAHLSLARPYLRDGGAEASREAVEQLERSGRLESLTGVLLNPRHANALLEPSHRGRFQRAWRRVLGDESPIPRYRESLGETELPADEAATFLLNAVDAARNGGWHDGAETALRELLQTPERLGTEGHARASYLLGSLLLDAGGTDATGASTGPGDPERAREAEQRLEQALSLYTDALGADSSAAAAARHALASLLEDLGETERAEALYEEALQLREQRDGTDSPAILPELANLAAIRKARNAHQEAKNLYRRAADIARKKLGNRHPATASALDHLAGMHYAEHDFTVARDLYQQALGVTEHAFGPRHAATAACLHNLATTLDACEDYRTAEQLYRQTLALRRELNGDRHVDTASSIHNLAAVLDITGQRDEAETLYREAIEIWEALVGTHHPATATSVNNLADLLRDVGRLGEAEQLYRNNLETWRQLVGEDHPHTLMTLTELGGLLTDAGRYRESEPLLRDAIDRTARMLGRSHSHHITAVCKMAVVHRDRGDREGARVLLEQTLAHVEGTLGLFSPQIQRIRRLLDNLQGSDTLH